MPILTFKDPSGQAIKVNSPDGSMPSEGELDKLFAMSKNKSNPAMQGGAKSPANVKAQQNLKSEQTKSALMDVPIVPLAGLNQFAGDIPRLMTGGKFPQPTTEQGRFASDVGGLVGATASPVYSTVLKGLRLVGKTMQEAGAMSKGLADTAKEVGAASKAPESITRRLGELKDTSTTPLKESIESEKTRFQDIKESLQKEIEGKKGLKSGKLEVTKDYQKAMKENIMSDLTSQKESLEEALQGSAEGIAKYMKDAIPTKVKSMNEIFGKHIDDISEAMEKSGKGISQTDRFNILNATKQEADDLGISTGRAKKLLDALHEGSVSTVEGRKVPTGILGADGKPMFSEVPGQGNEMIPFRDFIQETRQFRKIMADAKLSGLKGMNDEDIVGAIYNKNVNKYLEENVSGYRSLQKDYAPVINAMKTARRIFKPGDIYSDEQGVGLLKRYATGKASEGKESLLKDLQSSSRFGAGTKDVTTPLKSIGDKLAAVRTKISTMPKQLESKFSKELDDIKDSHDKEISALQEKLDVSKDESQAKIDSIKDKISEISTHYDTRIRDVRNTADKLNEFKSKAKWAALLGAVGLEGIGRKGQDLKSLVVH